MKQTDHFVPDGTYTVTLPDGSYRTLRIDTQSKDATFAPGERIISFLAGPNNEADYKAFGFVKPDGRINLWKRFRNGYDEIKNATRLLYRDFRGAGLNYAMESGRCFRCNRTLTVPASICQGLGPVCAEKIGA